LDNYYIRLINSYPGLIDQCKIPEEANFILSCSDPIDIVTIEISDEDFLNLKIPLKNMMGDEIYKLMEESD
jgi:hypothetical protein